VSNSPSARSQNITTNSIVKRDPHARTHRMRIACSSLTTSMSIV